MKPASFHKMGVPDTSCGETPTTGSESKVQISTTQPEILSRGSSDGWQAVTEPFSSQWICIYSSRKHLVHMNTHPFSQSKNAPTQAPSKGLVSLETPPLNIPAFTQVHTHTLLIGVCEWVPFRLSLVRHSCCVCAFTGGFFFINL